MRRCLCTGGEGCISRSGTHEAGGLACSTCKRGGRARIITLPGTAVAANMEYKESRKPDISEKALNIFKQWHMLPVSHAPESPCFSILRTRL